MSEQGSHSFPQSPSPGADSDVDAGFRIGTALTGNASKVMLLGSGELGKELAAAFQNLGLEVHAVDRYKGAPAHQVAQYSYVADINDNASVLQLAAEIKPHFVVPEVEMVSVEALLELEQAENCVVVPTARACALTADRENMRKTAESIGLPCTPYCFASSEEELRAAAREVGFPCIVKSDVAYSGRGHVVVRAEEDIAEAWGRVHRVTMEHPRVIVEPLLQFDYEVTMLAVRSIDPDTGELATWFSEPIGHKHENGDLVESWQPLEMSWTAMENSRSMAARISNELGGRGVYAVELFVAGDEVYFSGVSPRPSDAAMLTLRTQRFSEFELHARAILGYPIDVTMTTPGAAFVLHADEDIKDVVYTGLSAALAYEETDVRLFGKPGSYVGRRMGLVMATGENPREARDRAILAAHKIEIVDGNGA